MGRRDPRWRGLWTRRLRHEGRRGVDPRGDPGARRERGPGASRRGAARRVRAVRGGRRAGDARGHPCRRDRRPGDHPGAVQPRCRRRPCRRDHVPVDRSGPRRPRIPASGGRLGPRQAVRAGQGARGRRDAPQRGRDRPADDRARAALPDDHRHRRRRGVGVDRAGPRHRRWSLRCPARTEPGRGRSRTAVGHRDRLCR